MWAVWLLAGLALSFYSTAGDVRNLTDIGGEEPGALDCLKMGAGLTQLSKQNKVTQKLLSGKWNFSCFLS